MHDINKNNGANALGATTTEVQMHLVQQQQRCKCTWGWARGQLWPSMARPTPANKHWSGVAAGEDFALVLKYDERLYRPANVCRLRLPRARDTISCCALPTFLTKPARFKYGGPSYNST